MVQKATKFSGRAGADWSRRWGVRAEAQQYTARPSSRSIVGWHELGSGELLQLLRLRIYIAAAFVCFVCPRGPM